MQPREWLMLVLLIAIPLAIAVVVTLWSIKQMAYTPKKPARPKPVLSADEIARLASVDDGEPSPLGGGPAASRSSRPAGAVAADHGELATRPDQVSPVVAGQSDGGREPGSV